MFSPDASGHTSPLFSASGSRAIADSDGTLIRMVSFVNSAISIITVWCLLDAEGISVECRASSALLF